MSLSRWMILIAAGAALAGCDQPGTVVNPDYASWMGFEPGSFVTFEGTQTVGGQAQPIRITETLVSKDAARVVLERTTVLGDRTGDAEPVRRVESARINPTEDPRTHPAAVIRDLGTETIEVAGKTFRCPVRGLELHAHSTGFIEETEDMSGRAAVHSDMPGRFVKVSVHSRTRHHEFEMSGQIVDFHAIRKEN